MTIFANHVIDSLRGRGRYRLSSFVDKEPRLIMARMIEDADKFDFGYLPLEKPDDGDDEHKDMFAVPELTAVEQECWAMGLLPLPAPVCWYEFEVEKDSQRQVKRSMILVSQGDTTLRFYRFDIAEQQKYVMWYGSCLQLPIGAAPISDNFEVYMVGDEPVKHIEELSPALRLCIIGTGTGTLAAYLTMMLYSQTTEHRGSPMPSRVKNQILASKGLAKLPAHRIVTIVPARFEHEAKAEGTRLQRPPRLHWRRTHLRHFDHQTGNSKWFPDLEWKGLKGWWVVSIARMLVGRADLGEVSHEYRVRR